MSTHFSEDQFAGWLAGERSAGDAAHLTECGSCAQRVRQTESALRTFRDAMLSAAAPQIRAKQVADRARRTAIAMPLAWGVAAIIVISLSAAPLLRHKVVPPTATSQIAQRTASDDELMQRVDEETAELVPDSLQPLASRMQAAPIATNNSSAPTQGSSHK